ncbi:type IV pilus modification protein PilV [Pseudomonas sp. NCHU5208]|uniref:type IV pilus modification protein PilV n=1 Tax=unclassified Pseudomonas TaxID=196821 RepID=UPI003F9D0EB0
MTGLSHRAQAGATLIEVLVAIVVLSIGLLGLAGLQATSIQANQSAYYRSQASILAADITDRMRANRKAAQAGDYNLSSLTNTYTTTTTRKDKDLSEWISLVTKLPSGKARIERDNSTGLVTITINWDESRGAIKKSDGTTATADATANFVYRTEI